MLMIASCAKSSEPVSGATVPEGEGRGGAVTMPEAPVPGLVPTMPEPRFAPPEQPDPVFLQRLVDVFDRIQNDAVVHLAARGDVDEVFRDSQRAIYTDAWLSRSLEAWEVEKDALRPEPGQARTTVGRIVTWGPKCIVATVDTNYAAWFAIEQPPLPQRYIALVPRPEPVPEDVNPTGWIMAFDGWQDDGATPAHLCLG